MTTRLFAFIALCLVAAAAPAQERPAAPTTPAANAAPSVRTQPFEQMALRPAREAPASVVPRNEARLAAEVAGRIVRWTADTGARVRRGAVLVELDATDYRLARDRAQAALKASEARHALARQQLQRARELVEQGFFSKEALNARETEAQLAETEVSANRAQLATAQRALDKTRIRAPFDASVTERMAQTGEFVAAGAPLYVLTQADGAEVSAQVALADVASVRASRELAFIGPEGRMPLKLLRVAATVSAPARTVEVRLAPQKPLVIGSAGQLRWVDPRPHIPAALLVRRDRQLGVFTVENGKAKFVPLPEAEEGRAAAATLPGGTKVVVEGQAALRDGQPVAPRP